MVIVFCFFLSFLVPYSLLRWKWKDTTLRTVNRACKLQHLCKPSTPTGKDRFLIGLIVCCFQRCQLSFLLMSVLHYNSKIHFYVVKWSLVARGHWISHIFTAWCAALFITSPIFFFTSIEEHVYSVYLSYSCCGSSDILKDKCSFSICHCSCPCSLLKKQLQGHLFYHYFRPMMKLNIIY